MTVEWSEKGETKGKEVTAANGFFCIFAVNGVFSLTFYIYILLWVAPFPQWAISAFHFSWFCVHVYNAVFVPRGAGSLLASPAFYLSNM